MNSGMNELIVNQPLFSILIANYNNGRFLMEAIESVKIQSFSNWEIILVDDASTDDSSSLYEQLELDERIHVYYNGENRGCGYTKRRCVEMASGQICGFLDPDDVLLPDALLSHVATHLEMPGISCVFSRYYRCDENLNVVKESRKLIIPLDKTYFTNKDYSVEAFSSFKKVCYNQTKGIDSDIKAAVDQDLFFKLEEVAPIYILDRITYKYRIHSRSVSNKPTNEDVYWNLIVRHRTCLRRGLDPSDYPVQDFIRFTKNVFNEGADRTRLSLSYRIGHFFMKPFSFFKK